MCQALYKTPICSIGQGSKKIGMKQPRPWAKRITWGPLSFRSGNFCRSRSASPTNRPFWNTAHKKTIHSVAFLCSIKHKWSFFQTGKGLSRRWLWPGALLPVLIKEPHHSFVLALPAKLESDLELWQTGSLEHKNVSSMRADGFFLEGGGVNDVLFNDVPLVPWTVPDT